MSKEVFLCLLFKLQDLNYLDFNAKLIPNVPKERMIGVRVPELRKLAKRSMKERREESLCFLDDLPHHYYEENLLHAFLIENLKDIEDVFRRTEEFLPHVDNWAVCDCFSPKLYKKHREKLLPHIDRWLNSRETYSVRYGIGMLMQHFLGEEFQIEFLERVARIRSEEYYIRMMQAWYFCEALIKQWDSALPYIEQKKLEDWTHNKAIQKATESYRLTEEEKQLLRKLKVTLQKRC